MALQSYAVFPDLLKQMIGCPWYNYSWIGAAGWLGVGGALGIAVAVVVTGLKFWRFVVDRRYNIARHRGQMDYSLFRDRLWGHYDGPPGTFLHLRLPLPALQASPRSHTPRAGANVRKGKGAAPA